MFDDGPPLSNELHQGCTATPVSLRKVEDTMAMKDKIKNMLQVSRGKTKRAAGHATGDADLTAEGRADVQAGNMKQAGEKVKDAFREP
jgi:uncharacterized protein YjbJ (UPF0337 family)